MKKLLNIGIVMLLVATLAGCQKTSTLRDADSQKQASHSKVVAKKKSRIESESKTKAQSKSVFESREKADADSKIIAESDAKSKAETESNANAERTAKNPDLSQLVPDDLQGTWYSSDDYSSSPIIFAPNEIKVEGSVTEIHGLNEMTEQDKRVINNNDFAAMNNDRKNWLSANVITDTDGNKWLNLRGWYQTAGDGSFYKVSIKQINGQSIKVMTSAHGAGIWSDAHYYLSPTLADANKNRTYPDDHFN